ncbi:MAG: hypothetical protein WBL21_11450, partial [Salinimicrobium sp.]
MAEGLLENTAAEKIYVHYNSSLIFPGEYFMYSVYNVKENGEPFNFSKIAYVELIAKDGQLIFKQKVSLEKGRGSADFFVPTSTPSGSYKLLAYTNWMKNFKNNIFEGDVVVVNPYKSIQWELLENNSASLATEKNFPHPSKTLKTKDKGIEITLNKMVFGNRDQVLVDLQCENTSEVLGRYS